MTGDPLVERDQLIGDLRGAVHNGESGLNYVPRLLRRVLETDAWRERYDIKTRKSVTFESFAEFVTTAPTEGLGASMDLIDRIVGTGDPDLLRLLRAAKKGRSGRPRRDEKTSKDSFEVNDTGHSDYAAARLAREAPEEYEAVKRGERSIHAAAVRAGIRRRRMSIRLDSPESAAKALRKHMPPDARQALARLLLED